MRRNDMILDILEPQGRLVVLVLSACEVSGVMARHYGDTTSHALLRHGLTLGFWLAELYRCVTTMG